MWPHWGVLTVKFKACLLFIRGGLIHSWQFWWLLQCTNAQKPLHLPFLTEGSLAWNGVPGDLSRNPLGTLGVSDRSSCGAVLILLLKEILCRDLGKEVFYRELAQRSCHGDLVKILYKDLLQRSCTEILLRDFIESLNRDVTWRFLTESFCRGLL